MKKRFKTDGKYILDAAGNPVPETDLFKWADWMQTANRRVAFTELGDLEVSTVFMGLDYAYGDHAPELFETMVFSKKRKRGDSLDGYTNRYSTRSEALAGHDEVVQKLLINKK